MSNSVEKQQYITQRRTMGILVLLLAPLSVLLGLFGLSANPDGWWYSISDTFYASSKVVMIGIISVSAYFFCTYKGYSWKDRVVNLMSGIGLFGLLLFPCKNEGLAGATVGLFNLPIAISGGIHNTCAILAFVGFFLNEMFIFTLNKGEMTKEKKRRNIIYRICASGVPLAAVGLILSNTPLKDVLPPNMIWISEAVALGTCGFAWLVKGEALTFLNDKE